MLLEFFMSDFARRVREYITYKRRRNMGKVENEGMPVVRLDRQLKYQGNILKIYEDTVLANGHEAHWDYIHHDGAAAVLPVTSEGKI